MRKHGNATPVVRNCMDPVVDGKIVLKIFGSNGPVGAPILVAAEAIRAGVLPAEFYENIIQSYNKTFEKSKILSREKTFEPFLYCRLFEEAKDEHLHDADALIALGEALSSRVDGYWPPKLCGLPAAYAYFGQLIAHDLTSMHIKKDGGVTTLRSPILDLESIFGSIDPGVPPPAEDVVRHGGLALGLTTDGRPDDLPRSKSGEPVIPDQRNDQNLAVAQLHVLVIKFYQKILSTLKNHDEARTVVTYYIQCIILYDYLRRLIDESTYYDVINNGAALVADEFGFSIPLEFSAAFFRVGHSMVSPSYLWRGNSQVSVSDFLDQTYNDGKGSLKDGKLRGEWSVDWTEMIGPSELARGRYNRSSGLDASIARGLSNLEIGLVDDVIYHAASTHFKLSIQTLLRGRALRLPDAQHVYRDFFDRVTKAGAVAPSRSDPLSASMIRNTAFPPLRNFLGTQQYSYFAETTPLYLYAQLESEILGSGQKMGPMTSRIVMETVYMAIKGCKWNPIDIKWRPDIPGLEFPATLAALRHYAE